MALTLGDEKNVEGELGLDTLDLAPAFALAIGAAGHDAAEPLGSGIVERLARPHRVSGAARHLPGGGELRPVSGVLRGDGQSLSFEAINGGIGGGEASASIDARQTGNGIALNARVQLSGVDGAALRYRGLQMPAGRASMQMTLASQGRSASALTGALSGSGTVTLESARVAGLDPRAFEVAIRASDSGQATDDVKLRQIVEPVLSAGALSVESAQIPFSIRDGRIRIGATTLDAEGARAIVSGGYDIPADQADIRASLASTAAGSASSRPEIQLFAVGTPDALDRTVDVAALSSWLAVRAIDRETRQARCDRTRRAATAVFRLAAAGDTQPPGRRTRAARPANFRGADPRPRSAPAAAPKAKAAIPRPPACRRLRVPQRPVRPQLPAPQVPAPQVPVRQLPAAPVVGQQAAPLPPPIEVTARRPAPARHAAAATARRPLVLTPPGTGQP